MIRHRANSVLRSRLDRRTVLLGRESVERSTIVLAPHADDETLGCGGLIALKRDAGVPVTVVFLTDGAGSHPGATRSDLAATRRHEALKATSILGVAADDVFFLEIPDGELEQSTDRAEHLLEAIVREASPDQVILPHHLEPPADHRVVRRIMESVASRLGTSFDGYAYPVWLWDQWPWTNPLAPPRVRHGRRQRFDIARRDRLGTRLTTYLTHRVDVGTVLDRKRTALAAHRTQMERPPTDPDWLTLTDIADGEWIRWMLDPTEYYAAVHIGAAIGDPQPARTPTSTRHEVSTHEP